jgi:hypothetical protein
MRTSYVLAGALSVIAASYACEATQDGTSAPSCADLQQEINACTNVPPSTKSSLGTFCARTSDECHTCLRGHLCGVTEQCDTTCGKLEADAPARDAGSDGGTSGATDGGAPTCDSLQAQLEACPALNGAKPSFTGFCGQVSPECRTCFDGKLCGVSVSCAAPCQVSTAASCATLQGQIDACTNVPASTKESFGPFCAAASAACRACLDQNLCGVTEQCDPLCKATSG